MSTSKPGPLAWGDTCHVGTHVADPSGVPSSQLSLYNPSWVVHELNLVVFFSFFWFQILVFFCVIFCRLPFSLLPFLCFIGAEQVIAQHMYMYCGFAFPFFFSLVLNSADLRFITWEKKKCTLDCTLCLNCRASSVADVAPLSLLYASCCGGVMTPLTLSNSF